MENAGKESLQQRTVQEATVGAGWRSTQEVEEARVAQHYKHFVRPMLG